MTSEQISGFVKKQPIGVVSGLLALILVIAIYYRSEELPTAEALFNDKNTEGSRLATNLKNAIQLKEQFAAMEVADKEMTSRLVRPSEQATNLQYFYKLESETGTKLVEVRQNTVGANFKGTSKAGFIPVSFNVSVQGTYAQLLTVLRRLENGAYYCRVLSFSLNGAGGARGESLTLAITLELFGQP